MSTSESKFRARLALSGRARDVSFGEDTLVIDLEDGRQIAVPIAWFPRLVSADAAQRSNWKLVGRGIGISWPDIDEDISVENLLGADGELLVDQSSLASAARPPESDNPAQMPPGPGLRERVALSLHLRRRSG